MEDFFEPVAELKSLFSDLLNAGDKDRISIIPSASYGLANAANNIPHKQKGEIILLEGQFPSNYYIWKKVCDQKGMRVKFISKPKEGSWSDKILNSINEKTAAVAMGNIHWADGSLFDVNKIGERCKKYEAFFIIDGTQSIGALPFDIKEIQADAVICSAYKWLLGPYGFGLAYYGPSFDAGKPIEESWFSKVKSDEFSDLVEYQEEYRAKAWRYNVGGSSNFVYVKMMIAALKTNHSMGS